MSDYGTFSVCVGDGEKLAPDLQKEDDASVGHGVRQTQNPAAHNGIAEIEDGHAERGLPFKLTKSKDKMHS